MREKVILITGGAKRIGAAITRTLHATGASVAIHCHRSEVEANALATALNAQREDSALVFQCEMEEP